MRLARGLRRRENKRELEQKRKALLQKLRQSGGLSTAEQAELANVNIVLETDPENSDSAASVFDDELSEPDFMPSPPPPPPAARPTHKRAPTDPDPRFEEALPTPAPVPAVFAAPLPPLAPILQRWTTEVNDILERACRPLITLLGAVSVKLRMESVERLLVYDKARSPAQQRARVAQMPALATVEEWARANLHLGIDLLDLFIASVTVEDWRNRPEDPRPAKRLNAPIMDIRALDRGAVRPQALADVREEDVAAAQAAYDDAVRSGRAEADQLRVRLDSIQQQLLLQGGVRAARLLIRNQEAEGVFAPAWALGVLPEEALERFVSPGAWAAIQMAVEWIKRQPNCGAYTLKVLIASPTVMDHFATVVAYHYLNVGDAGVNVPGGANSMRRGGRGSQNYLNVNRMRMELGARMMATAIWFSLLIPVTHPLLRAFEERLRGVADVEQRRQLETYRPNLPQIQLIVAK